MPRRGDTLSEVGPLAVRIGALVALGLGVFVCVLILARSADRSYEVTAVFDDVRGLVEGGEVKAGGVNVGRVEEITFGDDGLPHVRLGVDEEFRLRQGATASVRMTSNIGAINRYVELESGDGGELADGATLGPSATDQPVDLDLAVSALDPRTRAEVAAVLAGAERALDERGADLARGLRHSTAALGESADLLAEVSSDGEALRDLVADGARVMGALAERPESLTSAAERLASVLRASAGRGRELRRTALVLGPAVADGRLALARLAEAAPNLRALVSAARPAVDELVPTGEALRPALAAARPLLDEAGRLIAAAPAQLRALEPAIERAGPVVRRLEPVVDGLNPFLDHLRARAPEVVNFFVLAADATANYDANGNLIRATAIAIQTPPEDHAIGPSETGPGLLRRPFDRTPGSLENEAWEDYADSFVGGGQPPESFIEPEERTP